MALKKKVDQEKLVITEKNIWDRVNELMIILHKKFAEKFETKKALK